MEEAYLHLETQFITLLRYLILGVEAIGCGVLVVSVLRALAGYLGKKAHLRRVLAEGLVLSLEFKMGAELLRTVALRSREELVTLGAVILLRAVLNLLLEWEIHSEEKRELAASALSNRKEESL